MPQEESDPLDQEPFKRLEGKDYLDLWKYFESRAEQLKSELFKLFSIFLGFASALLGFLANKILTVQPSGVSVLDMRLTVLICLAGLLMCAYAGVMLAEYRKHIIRNWDRGGRAREVLIGLPYVLEGVPPKPYDDERLNQNPPKDKNCKRDSERRQNDREGGNAAWYWLAGLTLLMSLPFLVIMLCTMAR